MEVAIYLRKSRAEELSDTTDETLARHKRLLLDYAQTNHHIVLEVYEEVVSGESLYARPQMLRLLENVESREYEGVLCMDIDRLGRGGSRDQGIILEAFKYSCTAIVTLDKVYDLSLESDEMLAEFKGIISRQEYRMITKRLRRGLEETIKEGGYVSNAPYGYKRIYKEKVPTLEIVDEEAYFVRLMYQLYIEGVGCETIARRISQMGAKPRRGEAFCRTTIRKILSSPTYLGKVVWNQKQHIKPGKQGNKTHKIVYNPPEKWHIVDGIHPPIIQQEEFDRAQIILRNRYIPSKRVAGVLANPFAGLILCGNCGSKMQLKYSQDIPYIMCLKPACITSTRFDVVEEVILSIIRKEVMELKAGYERESHRITDQGDTIKKALSSCEKERAQINKQVDSIRDLLEQGAYDIATYQERMQVLKERLDSLEVRRELLQNQNPIVHLQIVQDVITKLKEVVDIYAHSDINCKNRMLKSVIDEIIYLRPGRKSELFLHAKYRGIGFIENF